MSEFIPVDQIICGGCETVLSTFPDNFFDLKEKALNGERHTYVLELILEMRKQGWLLTEEFIWHKKNSYA